LAIKAHEAHAVGAKGAGARVAILDMGADFNHPELYNRFNPLLSQSFVDGESVQFTPGMGYPASHATMMAGVIAASKNGFGVEGVAPEAELVLVKVVSDSGAGTWEALVRGIVYAAFIDSDVINMSLGGYMTTDGYDLGNPYDASDDVYIGADGVAAWREAMSRAAKYAHKSGCTLVGAAGNDSLNRDLYSNIVHLPSDLPHVISVSGTGPLGYGLDQTTSLDELAYYTNYGDPIDVAAPGGNIDIGTYLSGELAVVAGLPAPAWLFDLVFTTDYGGYQVGLGTSFSAAHVSGVAALVAAERGNDRGAGAVAAIVVNSADDLGATGPDDFYGKGRVNALRAVQIGRGDNDDDDDGDDD
ncbi:MAG TPA: S8 family serine peptidase, partial [Pirellulaceae bacterium]|nr:S8 family serine peptidase [Pirellulaceae bacterium]